MQVSTKYEYLLFDLRNREQGSLAIAVLQSEDALCPLIESLLPLVQPMQLRRLPVPVLIR